MNEIWGRFGVQLCGLKVSQYANFYEKKKKFSCTWRVTNVKLWLEENAAKKFQLAQIEIWSVWLQPWAKYCKQICKIK